MWRHEADLTRLLEPGPATGDPTAHTPSEDAFRAGAPVLTQVAKTG